MISPQPGAATGGDPARQRQEKTHIVSVRLLTPTFGRELEKLPAFDVSVENKGTSAVSLNPSCVAVFSGATPVRAYTGAELVTMVQKRAEQEAQEKSAASAETILQTPLTRNEPGSALGMVERTKSMDQARNARVTPPEELAELANTIIPVRINPGETGTGVVKVHPEDIVGGRPLRVVVTLDGEAYEFAFVVGPGA